MTTRSNEMPATMSVQEFAEAVGVSRSIAYALVHSGQVKTLHAGRIFRIPRQAVDDFLSRVMAEGVRL